MVEEAKEGTAARKLNESNLSNPADISRNPYKIEQDVKVSSINDTDRFNHNTQDNVVARDKDASGLAL